MSSKNFSNRDSRYIKDSARDLSASSEAATGWDFRSVFTKMKKRSSSDSRFKKSDLHKLGESGVKSKQSPPSHFVQFYDNDESIVTAIKNYINNYDSTIIVATKKHVKLLKSDLVNDGVNLESVNKNGSLRFLDASETLSKFMVDGMPNPKKFKKTIGSIVKEASINGKKVRIYGEMVAVLWSKGFHKAAIKLEKLWNKIQKEYHFTLFCAYPIRGFGSKKSYIRFKAIEGTHTHVIPSESYSSLADKRNKLRKIARLQQKAEVLSLVITEHRKTEKTLRSTVAKLKATEDFNKRMIENSPDSIKILDLNGNIMTLNTSALRLMAVKDAKSYIGYPYCDSWKGEYYEVARKAVNEAKAGRVGRFTGSRPTLKGEVKWWDVAISPILGDNGKVQRLFALSRDITFLKELDQRKEDFLNATSHELKTPLTSQQAFIQLLKRKLQEERNEKDLEFVNKIEDQTKKLYKIVSNLLDTSKIQNGKLLLNKKSFNINTVISDSIHEVVATHSHHRFVFSQKIKGKVFGDSDKIAQVLLNLLTNAVKFSEGGTQINIQVSEVKGFAQVSVRDQGEGIPEKYHNSIFERFFQMDVGSRKKYPGLGIGLFIAAEIIKLHNGKIWVESEKRGGSTFRFTIPLYEKNRN